MPLCTLQETIDSEEFVLWTAYLRLEDEKEYKENKKWEYYLAQITYYQYLAMSSGKRKGPTLDDFLFKFQEPIKPRSDGQKLIDRTNSKLHWFGIVGIEAKELIDGDRKKGI